MTERLDVDICVIGAGSAGLSVAAGASQLGQKVVLIERGQMGGDCLNTGCVPSKSLIAAARAAHAIRGARRFGVTAGEPAVDYRAVREHVRGVIADIAPTDSVERFTGLGVNVIRAAARFTATDEVEAGGARIRARRFVIATGSSAAVPPIPGLKDIPYLTNETVFDLEHAPGHLLVIGGGPIGCELAQALQRLGCEVTLVQDAAHVLEREDEDAAAIIQRALVRDGVQLVLSAEVLSVQREGSEKVVRIRHPGGEAEARVDEILVAAGRLPNVEDLGLEAVGVEYERRRGVVVDDHLRTTNPRIFAAGDVCMDWKFTHAADFAARIVIQNALFFGRKRLSALHMPWCTYTTPELAHVGLSTAQAQARGIATDTFIRPLAEVDRAVIDGEEDGFVKVLVKRGTDRILGATIVATHAGDLISEISLAMVARVGLATLATVIHPYPTQADAIRHIGDLYNRSRLTPAVSRAFKLFLRLTR